MKRALLLTLVAAWASSASGQAPEKKSLPPRVAKSVKQVTDISYAGTDNPRQSLDLILPTKPSAKKLPVIVFIHGGAWRQGDKRGGRNLLTPYVNSGKYAGVSVAYRLSQEAKWPAQIHDCKAAIRWIRGNADKHGLDPDKVAVWGTSAGGHLVAMLGVSGDIETLEGSLGDHTKRSSRVTCVANYFGPADLLSMDKFPSDIVHNAPDSPESQLVGGAIQEHPEKTRQASPLTHVSEDDAPFLHVHGDKDRLVPFNQSVQLDHALDEANVASLLITMKDKGHGRFESPGLNRLLEQFFAVHLLGASHDLKEQTFEPVQKTP